jgi:hypothetical protein
LRLAATMTCIASVHGEERLTSARLDFVPMSCRGAMAHSAHVSLVEVREHRARF